MKNNELIESLKSRNLSKDSKKIISSGFSLIGKVLDMTSPIPVFDLVTSITNGVVAIREYNTLKMIAFFFEEIDSLSFDERTEFIYQLKYNNDFEEFTEKIIFYLTSVHDKKKAKWIAKMTLGLARKKIGMEEYEQSIYIIVNSMPGDLDRLSRVIRQAVYERQNDLIPPSDYNWYTKYVFKYIGLHYFDEMDKLKEISNRTINHFISLGLMEWGLKEKTKSGRGLGIDPNLMINDGYEKVYSMTHLSTIIFFLALIEE